LVIGGNPPYSFTCESSKLSLPAVTYRYVNINVA